MKRLILTTIAFLLFLDSAKSQSNDVEAAVYNIGIGSLFSACGAILNKKKEEKVIPVVYKALWQGALGGYLTFESKRLLRPAYKNSDWKLYWSSKILNAAGTSIKENAAMNKDFWEQWNMNIAFIRFELHTKNKMALRARIMPITAVYVMGAAFQTNFELQKSMQTGHVIFTSNSAQFDSTNSIGIAFPGLMVIKDGHLNNYQLISHEAIHIYQGYDFVSFNSLYIKHYNKLENAKKPYNWLCRNVYPDLHYIPLRSIYLIEYRTAKNYYDNFLEHEAGYYSNTLF